jgi:PAS domain S-box-containing protein
MLMDKDINCSNFRGLLCYLGKHYGDEGVWQTLDGLVDDNSYLVADKENPSNLIRVHEHHLNDSAYWVSNEFSLALFANAKKVVGGSNALVEAGEHAVIEQFSKTILFLSRIFSTKFVCKQPAKVNARFNRTKQVKLCALTNNSAVFELHYYPGFQVTKDICNWNMGIYTGIAKMTGALDVKCEEIECVVAGDEHCSIRMTWKKGPSFLKQMLRWFLKITSKDLITDYEETVQERDQLIDNLRQSEERYRALTDQSLTGIFIHLYGKIVYVNDCLAQMLSYSPGEMTDKKLWDFVHHADRNMVQEREMARSNGADTITNYEFRAIQKNGEPLWLGLFAATINFNGHSACMGNVIDLTSQKQAEEDSRKLEAHIQQSQKMEAIGTLAGGIAHDFNNLLMGIQGRASLMTAETNLTQSYLEHLKGIEAYVTSASDLTKQLLGFARGGKYEVKPADLNEIVKKQNRMFGRTKKEITIREKYENNLWSAVVDQGQIEQVLLNLYINAWQSMPGGGILYVQTENVILDENCTESLEIKQGNYVKISVADTGVGMDAATRKRIFDPFFTTKEMSRGTGLGLSSVYGIIKNHGGFIDVKSVKGEGAVFDIYLPASEGEVIKKKAKEQQVLKGSETVLLVDDEDIIIDVGKELLAILGYTALIARNGTDAIKICQENQDHIDMVILDMIMPEMDGGETYDKLKKVNPDLKVLLSSGYSIHGQAAEILERGCDGFIQKPFDIENISQKIREVLDNR